jgi:hypothetical protein
MLPELGLIEVGGADAAAFLQSQLTNDVTGLDPAEWRQAGYCSAKGRLQATFHLWRSGEAIELLLPAELLAPIVKRLSMFVLRARAKVQDASARYSVCALLGPGALARVEALLGAAPAGGRLVERDGARALRLSDAPRLSERFLLLLPAGDQRRDALGDLPVAAASLFWWSQIDAAQPTVFAATQERFVPQMINFELVGGVSFKKGCYPGQEVVARSQYLGKLRRRMSLAHCGQAVAAGADVFAADAPQAIGTVVMAAPAPGGGFDVLFECPVERSAAALHATAADGPALQPRALPYPIVDITA